MTALTATVAEACNNFSRIAEQVNRSGREVNVFRHSKPWVKISPRDEERQRSRIRGRHGCDHRAVSPITKPAISWSASKPPGQRLTGA